MSQQSDWRHFVAKRRGELTQDYPCAAPTARQLCPRHRIPVPQEATIKRGANRGKRIRLSGICKPCRDELFAQLATEYANEQPVDRLIERRKEMNEHDKTQLDIWDEDEPEEMPEERLQAAEAALILSERMRERGVTALGQLGNLPPLDPETRTKYLAGAEARRAS